MGILIFSYFSVKFFSALYYNFHFTIYVIRVSGLYLLTIILIQGLTYIYDKSKNLNIFLFKFNFTHFKLVRLIPYSSLSFLLLHFAT